MRHLLTAGSFLLLCGVAASAQQPSPATPPQTTAAPVVRPATDEPEDRVPAPTPLEQREKEVRQFDPLDQNDSKAADDNQKGQDQPEQQNQQRKDSRETPLPGSIAASDARDAAAKGNGPQVVGNGEDGSQPAPYAGPAVLSHSYTVNSSLIPENLLWTETFGVSALYDTGVNAVATAGTQGSVQNASALGLNAHWSISGRHKFHRDSLGIVYNGDRSWYTEGSQYTGLNSRFAADYLHVVSRRISVRLTEAVSLFSQSYTLQNQAPPPEAPAADINLATTALPQIFDNGFKTYMTGVAVTWQQSARLSYTANGTYFANSYDNANLLSVSGEQASGNVNYRWSSRVTVGAFYSFNVYTFPHHSGMTDSQSLGFLYSNAISRSTRVQIRAGIGRSETNAYETVTLNPIIAYLTGLQSEVIDGYFRSTFQDISASVSKDFHNKGTITASYSRGIMPGNGIFLAGESTAYSLTETTRLLRRYQLIVSLGRSSIYSASQASDGYTTDFAHIGLSRPLDHNVSMTFGIDYRYYQIGFFSGLRNEVSVNCGLNWGHTENKIWPF
jgi:hypothetical protein